MTRHRPGFTLIETLIYTAFVGMMMISMTLLAYTAFVVRSKVRASLILEENIRFAVNRITFLVTEASAVTVPALGSSSGTLVLTMPTPSQNPTTITSNGGTIFITQSTGTAQALTSNEVFVSRLAFTRVSSSVAMVRFNASGTLRNAIASYASLAVTTTASIRR